MISEPIRFESHISKQCAATQKRLKSAGLAVQFLKSSNLHESMAFNNKIFLPEILESGNHSRHIFSLLGFFSSNLDQTERNAKQNFRTLSEETIPDSQNSLNMQQNSMDGDI